MCLCHYTRARGYFKNGKFYFGISGMFDKRSRARMINGFFCSSFCIVKLIMWTLSTPAHHGEAVCTVDYQGHLAWCGQRSQWAAVDLRWSHPVKALPPSTSHSFLGIQKHPRFQSWPVTYLGRRVQTHAGAGIWDAEGCMVENWPESKCNRHIREAPRCLLQLITKWMAAGLTS